MESKITSLHNKLINENEKRVVMETKCSDRNSEFKTAQQELRREKKVSNNFVDNEKKQAADVLQDSRAIKEELNVTMKSVVEKIIEDRL